MLTTQIFQIEISLKFSNPKIWRRLLVPSDMLLPDLHWVIQIAMGWMDSHLHQFIVGKKFYLDHDTVDDFWDDAIQSDYNTVKLKDIISKENEIILYEYDFGDSWLHEIKLEKILTPQLGKTYPNCLAGEHNCPPEDIGGIPGYLDMLEVLKNPKHPEYIELTEWLDDEDGFDPEYFDKQEVNEVFGIEFGAQN